MVNTPIPHSLKSEAKKAAKILKEFTVPTAKMGPDKLIPGNICRRVWIRLARDLNDRCCYKFILQM